MRKAFGTFSSWGIEMQSLPRFPSVRSHLASAGTPCTPPRRRALWWGRSGLSAPYLLSAYPSRCSIFPKLSQSDWFDTKCDRCCAS